MAISNLENTLIQFIKIFISSPQAIISSVSALIAVGALVAQIFFFRFNGSRIKASVQNAFWNRGFSGFARWSITKHIPAYSKENQEKLKNIAMNGEGIELIKVSIANRGRMADTISNITVGFHRWDFKNLNPRILTEYTPTFLKLDSNISPKHAHKLPYRLNALSEVKYVFDLQSIFPPKKRNWKYQKLHVYIHLAGKKKPIKAKPKIMLHQHEFSVLNPDGKIPLRLVASRYFSRMVAPECKKSLTHDIIVGDISYASRLLGSYLNGSWPKEFEKQDNLIREFCYNQHALHFLPSHPNSSFTEEDKQKWIFFSKGEGLRRYLNSWSDAIAWDDIAQPNLWDHNQSD